MAMFAACAPWFIRFGLATSVAAALLGAAPRGASAQSTPITVRSCTILSYSASSPHEFFYLQSGPPSQSNRIELADGQTACPSAVHHWKMLSQANSLVS